MWCAEPIGPDGTPSTEDFEHRGLLSVPVGAGGCCAC